MRKSVLLVWLKDWMDAAEHYCKEGEALAEIGYTNQAFWKWLDAAGYYKTARNVLDMMWVNNVLTREDYYRKRAILQDIGYRLGVLGRALGLPM